MMVLDVAELLGGKPAKLSRMAAYERAAKKRVPPGRVVTLTGNAPIWFYLRLAHALHGWARRLLYSSPVTGSVEIFNHSPD